MNNFHDDSAFFPNKTNADDTLIVLLHGGPGLSHEYLLPLSTKLSHLGTAATYQQGFSQMDSNDWSISKLTDELDLFIKKHKKRHLILAAHSFGSVIAINYASKFNTVS